MEAKLKNQYVLKIDENEQERLENLSDIYNYSSQEFIIENIKNEPNKILDIGCGIGSISAWLSQRFSISNVIGIVNSETQLKIANEKSKQLKLKTNLNFLNLDINQQKFSKDNFQQIKNSEFIYVRYLLLHLKDWNNFFSNNW